jgi:hypothetical protein
MSPGICLLPLYFFLKVIRLEADGLDFNKLVYLCYNILCMKVTVSPPVCLLNEA